MLKPVRICAAILFFIIACASVAKPAIDQLRCEYLDNPLGIDATHPRLTWVLHTDKRETLPLSYRVLVASSPDKLKTGKADLWESPLLPDAPAAVYSGKALKSSEGAWWKVEALRPTQTSPGLAQESKPIASSAPARFEMGLLSDSDWKAKWICADETTNTFATPMFRREFSAGSRIKSARAYISGLGYHELRINGHKVGDHLLDPGYTRYDKRVLYVTHDVTPLLKSGPNAIAILLGNGWFNVQVPNAWNFDKAPWRAAPRVRCMLQIQYTDGRVEQLGTDGSWSCAPSPIVYNVIYGGETYDARMEQPGYDKPGFTGAAAWRPALLATPPGGMVVAQAMHPIKASETLKPVFIHEPVPGTFVFDFGRNISGFAVLKVSGKPGATIRLKYGERLGKTGLVDQSIIAQHITRFNKTNQFQTDTYVLKGEGTESWHSRFVYHGFQYVEVSGLDSRPGKDLLTAVFTHSAVPAIGTFECSNPMFNKIRDAGRRAYLSNLQGIPTDCPHREKNGWTGDAHLACDQGLFNFDSITVYEKWLDDLRDEQRADGALPGIVPTSGWGYQWGNGPAWDSALVLIPWHLYEFYGDTNALAENYDAIKRYVDYLSTRATNYIVSIGLNDWAPYKTETPADITSTAYYYKDTCVLAQAAKILGKESDAQTYSDLAAAIKNSFNKTFYHPETSSYGNGSQTSLSCALYQGLVPPEHEQAVLDRLVEAVEKTNGHIDTGILGAKYILHALSERQQHDIAFRIAAQKDQPGWGWWINQGATTLWEQWNGGDSRNHIMYGDILAWYCRKLAGISPDPEQPGFKHFFVKPMPANLTSAKASLNSVRGLIVSDWKKSSNGFELRVVVPANSEATVYIPSAVVNNVYEGRHLAASAPGVLSSRQTGKDAMFRIAAGSYVFKTGR